MKSKSRTNPAPAALAQETATGTDGSPWWLFVLLGLLFGLLLALSFPPVGLWWVALGGPAPLLVAGRVAATGRLTPLRSGLLVALGTLPAWAFEHQWLLNVSVPAWPLLSLSMCAFSGGFVWLNAVGRRARGSGGRRRWLTVFAGGTGLWMLLEFGRGEWFLTGYPWYLSGQPLIDCRPLAAPAIQFGAYIVSFLLVSANETLIDTLRPSCGRRWQHAASLAGVLLVWAGATLLSTTERSPAVPLRVGIIQTNLPQGSKVRWTLASQIECYRRWVALTRQAVSQGAEVVIWPETMFPGPALNPAAVDAVRKAGLYRPVDQSISADGRFYLSDFSDGLIQLQAEVGVPLVIGSVCLDGLTLKIGSDGKVEDEYSAETNSVVVIDGHGNGERYDKIALTPFGEFIPVLWRWKSLQDAALWLGASGMDFGLSRGKTRNHLHVAIARPEPLKLRIAAPICFEVAKSTLVRKLVYEPETAAGAAPRADGGVRPANLIVSVSNDGWFGAWKAGREVHQLSARWRCLELGVPMIRAVNTGISSVIDADGRIIGSGVDGKPGAAFEEGVLLSTVPIVDMPGPTRFARLGDGWIPVLAVVCMLAGAGWRRAGGAAGNAKERG